MPKFLLNQKVCLRDMNECGFVDKIFPQADGSFLYRIFIHAQRNPTVDEDDLVAAGQSREPVDLLRGNVYADLPRFRTFLTLTKLRNPLTDVVYAFLSSRTDFLPHQFVPVLKLLESPDQRLLIADEVGLGKTIEAGIILAELRSRRDVKRVLVICQGYSLQKKWQEELRDRFDEEFIIASGGDLLRFLQEYEEEKDPPFKAICSLPLLRNARYMERIAELQIPFDVVIVDEAHRVRNPDSESHHMAEVLSYNADVLLFLTATPLQMHSRDLFTLLNLLLPSEFAHEDHFSDLIAPNEHINRALATIRKRPFEPGLCATELVQIERALYGARITDTPYYKDVQEVLQGDGPWDHSRLVWLENSIQRMNVLSHVFTRTRRRDVDVNFPQRVAATVTAQLTVEESRFLDAVGVFTSRMFTLGGRGASFAAINLQRQAASSIPGMKQYLADILRKSAIEADTNETDLDLDLDNSGMATSYEVSGKDREELLKLYRVAGEIDGDCDSKFDQFLLLIRQQREQGADKFLVFSFFRRTLSYLHGRLKQHGIRVELLTGDVGYEDRIRVMEAFREAEEPFVLLSSEVGGEGLDFQFCNVLFNYDLPWNPMVVEQRIGRIDRYGQKRPKVFIFNFKIPDTIEERIFLRLYERIGIFERAIGNIEAILGEDLRLLTQQVLEGRLSPQEQESRAEEVARIVLKNEKALEELEASSTRLLGQDGLFMVRINDIHNSRRFVTPEELRALVADFLTMFGGRTVFRRSSVNDEVSLIERGDDLVSSLHLMIGQGAGMERVHSFVRRTLKRLELTFNSKVANEQRRLQFITPRHVLIKGIVEALKAALEAPLADPTAPALAIEAGLQNPGILPCASVTFYTDEVQAGEFVVFLFLMTTHSALKDLSLVPIAISTTDRMVCDPLGQAFVRLVHEADVIDRKQASPLADVDALEAAAISAMSGLVRQKKAEVMRNNDALIDLRLASRERSRDVQLARVDKVLAKVPEERIQRMKTVERANILARFGADKARMERDRRVSVQHELQAVCRVFVEPAANRPRHRRNAPSVSDALSSPPTEATPSSRVETAVARSDKKGNGKVLPPWRDTLLAAHDLEGTLEETAEWLRSALRGSGKVHSPVPRLLRMDYLDADELRRILRRDLNLLFRAAPPLEFDAALMPRELPAARDWVLVLKKGMSRSNEVSMLIHAIAHRLIGHIPDGESYGLWFRLSDVFHSGRRWDAEVADILKRPLDEKGLPQGRA